MNPVQIGDATLYLGDCRQTQTIHIRTHEDASAPKHGGKTGKTFSQYPFSAALAEVING